MDLCAFPGKFNTRVNLASVLPLPYFQLPGHALGRFINNLIIYKQRMEEGVVKQLCWLSINKGDWYSVALEAWSMGSDHLSVATNMINVEPEVYFRGWFWTAAITGILFKPSLTSSWFSKMPGLTCSIKFTSAVTSKYKYGTLVVEKAFQVFL